GGGVIHPESDVLGHRRALGLSGQLRPGDAKIADVPAELLQAAAAGRADAADGDAKVGGDVLVGRARVFQEEHPKEALAAVAEPIEGAMDEGSLLPGDDLLRGGWLIVDGVECV